MDEKEVICRKFENVSLNYHNLSLTFHELAQSLRIKAKTSSPPEFKKYIKEELKLDMDKIKKYSIGVFSLEDLKKDE